MATQFFRPRPAFACYVCLREPSPFVPGPLWILPFTIFTIHIFLRLLHYIVCEFSILNKDIFRQYVPDVISSGVHSVNYVL